VNSKTYHAASINSNFVPLTDDKLDNMLRHARMAGLRKLHRSNERGGRRRLWAVNYTALQSAAMLQDGEFSLRIRSFLRSEMVNGFAA